MFCSFVGKGQGRRYAGQGIKDSWHRNDPPAGEVVKGRLRRRSPSPATDEEMEEENRNFPLFPANYVTLLQLKERRMKEKQEREEREEEEEREKRREREEEEMRLRKEREEEEMRLRKEREEEEEEARERLKKEQEEKEKKMKESIKSSKDGNFDSQSRSRRGRRIGGGWEKREVDTSQERREVPNVDRERVGERDPKRKRNKQTNRRKIAEDKAAAGASDSSATTESKLEADRRSNVASPAVAPSLGADKAVKSEASIGRKRGIARKLRDLKINETGESNGVVSETGSSTAVVSESGTSPEAGNPQNIANAEVGGSKRAAMAGRKEFRSRSVAGKRGERGKRGPDRGGFRNRPPLDEKSGIWIRKEDFSGGGIS
ncbi:hypothetical protein H6P81_020742 [Aristolochia fimbriata]|uniref:Uncharacterized protein n=1 Tax=Aristolochia fimbriata TaxID=158543 RepID=A0AAV7DZR3_ARIFI|nr:hypothetical protein H6P81_020742 [Aristolochia fimbriata]